MSTESFSITAILIISWLILTILDLIVCGTASLISGIAFKKAFLRGLISLALPPLMIAYGTFIERNIFKVKSVEITFDNLPDEFDGYRIVQISDIHARSFAKRQKSLLKAVEKINGLEPDLIAFTGDLVTMVPEELDAIEGTLKSLHAKDGVISVLGNHDYGIYAGGPGSENKKRSQEESVKELVKREREMGWDILLDENRIIGRGEDSIAVIGVENTSPSKHFPSKGNLEEASEGTEGMFRILLSHDPMHWEMEVLGEDYPLTLSGHTHAMQFALFGWSPSRFIFRQHKGLYKEGNQYIYVNIGLGETIFPARIGTPPEITEIILRKP